VHLNDLYTVIDVNPTSPTYGKRVAPVNYPLSAVPVSSCLPQVFRATRSVTITGFPTRTLKGNFIWMTEAEKNQLGVAQIRRSSVKTVQFVSKDGQFGANTDHGTPDVQPGARGLSLPSQRIGSYPRQRLGQLHELGESQLVPRGRPSTLT
jgi:hypothetical protein